MNAEQQRSLKGVATRILAGDVQLQLRAPSVRAQILLSPLLAENGRKKSDLLLCDQCAKYFFIDQAFTRQRNPSYLVPPCLRQHSDEVKNEPDDACLSPYPPSAAKKKRLATASSVLCHTRGAPLSLRMLSRREGTTFPQRLGAFRRRRTQAEGEQDEGRDSPPPLSASRRKLRLCLESKQQTRHGKKNCGSAAPFTPAGAIVL